MKICKSNYGTPSLYVVWSRCVFSEDRAHISQCYSPREIWKYGNIKKRNRKLWKVIYRVYWWKDNMWNGCES